MKIIKVIDPDVDIDYHGKVDWKSLRRIVIYLVLVWALIIFLLTSCNVQQKQVQVKKTKWHIRLGDNREDPWAINTKSK